MESREELVKQLSDVIDILGAFEKCLEESKAENKTFIENMLNQASLQFRNLVNLIYGV